MIISAPRLFINGAFTGPGAVHIEHGRITAIMPGETAGDIQLTHGFLSPGLIDLHNNGAFGVDCATATPEEWDRYIAGLRLAGVTGVLPTIITAPWDSLAQAAARIAAAAARHPAILGLHLEGPFLSLARRGAHQAAWLRTPDDAAINALMNDPAMRATLRLITLAPELPGALPAITRLTAAGILVALGHTDATAAQMRAGADAGATIVTHVFNAQSPLAHRAPGAPGIALTDPRLAPCLITDGVHVDPILLGIAFAACPRAIAVTDSISLAGMPPGTQQNFGGAPARLGPQNAALRADGTLAGAAITLDAGLRCLIAAGIPAEAALAAATSRPAAALGLADRGILAPGARADLVWFSDDFYPLQTWVPGHTASPKTLPPGPETARPDLADLDERPTIDIIHAFLAQERAAQRALATAAPALAALVDAIAPRLAAGGRLFYAGAGTSGRLGLLDAAECGPTFGIEDGLIIPLLAGGPNAFLRAAENAEDDATAAEAALIAAKFGPADSLIGIAASGATPFTRAAITAARAAGGFTGAILNTPGTPLAAAAHIAVQIASGPEIIAGSTRLSAGTTQKIALNTLSSTIMLRLGKTYGPYMVDLRATNAKLRRRAIAMTAKLAKVDEPLAEATLSAARLHVKTAILMLKHNLTSEEATQRLANAKGSLRGALKAQE
jgi:N-acetylmuramic acid 6-phosphate etherase/N-acetylglucosamine-6-phosphate deacetylase